MWVGVLVYGLGGLLLLVLLWPTESSARKLLQRWRIKEPTQAQIAEARSYLRQRRFWYPWIFLAAPLVSGGLGAREELGGFQQQVIVTVLTALLIAELVALRPTRDRVRTAVLVRRGLFDLVPRWAVAVFAVVVLLTCTFAANGSKPWAIFGASVLCLLAVVGAVWLAVIRPASGDLVVDAVLRTRSARVALGLGIGLHGPLLVAGTPQLGWLTGWLPLVASVGTILAWIWVANPPAKVPLVAG
jgi:hypothetical protein